MKHSEASYIVIGGTVLVGCFAVIVMQLMKGMPAPTEAWFTVGGIVGHFFGRANGNGNGTNGNGGTK